MSAAFDRYAVIGHPIAHSRSPAIHARFADQVGHRMAYDRILAPLDGFAAAVDTFHTQGGRGLNATLPFKLEAFVLAGRRSARAEAAGAVNTLTFDGGQVLGDNTDGIGLVRDLTGRLGFALAGVRVLLLGAGGASRGVVWPLLEAGVVRVAIVNRTGARARVLAESFADPRVDGAGYEAFDGAGGFALVVDATSAGLGGEPAPVPRRWLAEAELVYEMVYGSRPGPLMRVATAAGCARTADGLGMLVEQAAESFRLWRGVLPDTRPVYAALRAELDAAA
jgi:shikimate dehydrogenase